MAATSRDSRWSATAQVSILRICPEEVADRAVEWRGKIQHVNSSEALDFRDWVTVESFVERLIEAKLARDI